MTGLDDIIETICEAPTQAALFGQFKSTMESLGLEHVVYFVLREPSHQATPDDYNTYPLEWIVRYEQQGFTASDLTLRTAAHHVAPFRWDSLIEDPAVGGAERRVFDEAREFEIQNGLTIPLHGPGNAFATLNIAGNIAAPQLDEIWSDFGPTLVGAGIFVHETALRLAAGQDRAKPARLSGRETECLAWSARGKTAWEISEILSISETTVQFHIENAKTKLGVYSKLHAVVKAIMHGMILP